MISFPWNASLKLNQKRNLIYIICKYETWSLFSATVGTVSFFPDHNMLCCNTDSTQEDGYCSQTELSFEHPSDNHHILSVPPELRHWLPLTTKADKTDEAETVRINLFSVKDNCFSSRLGLCTH